MGPALRALIILLLAAAFPACDRAPQAAAAPQPVLPQVAQSWIYAKFMDQYDEGMAGLILPGSLDDAKNLTRERLLSEGFFVRAPEQLRYVDPDPAPPEDDLIAVLNELNGETPLFVSVAILDGGEVLADARPPGGKSSIMHAMSLAGTGSFHGVVLPDRNLTGFDGDLLAGAFYARDMRELEEFARANPGVLVLPLDETDDSGRARECGPLFAPISLEHGGEALARLHERAQAGFRRLQRNPR